MPITLHQALAIVERRMSNPDLGLIERLRARLIEAISPVAQNGPYALLDFPNYANVGDSLLWLGGRRLLLDVTGVEPAYVSAPVDFDLRLLKQKLGARGTVFITGGGNTGDLWIDHQRFREHVARTCSAYRLVQLPQSVYFEHEDNERIARDAFASHPDFTLFVRDPESLARASTLGATRVALVPDIAFAVGGRARPAVKASASTVVLARDDKEMGAQSASLAEPQDLVFDWSDDGHGRAALQAIQQLMNRPRLWSRIPMHLRLRAFDLAARLRVDQGERLLAQGAFVRTDRLHAHIMCVLMGIPHEVADNSYGKVRALVEAWTHEATTLRATRWSASPSLVSS